MKSKLKQITNSNPQQTQYWRMRLKTKLIKKEHKKQLESIHQTHDPGHQTEITSFKKIKKWPDLTLVNVSNLQLWFWEWDNHIERKSKQIKKNSILNCHVGPNVEQWNL